MRIDSWSSARNKLGQWPARRPWTITPPFVESARTRSSRDHPTRARAAPDSLTRLRDVAELNSQGRSGGGPAVDGVQTTKQIWSGKGWRTFFRRPPPSKSGKVVVDRACPRRRLKGTK